jgi:hypothetical protein
LEVPDGTDLASATSALIKSLRPQISRADLEQLLVTSTVKVVGVAYGRVDAARALRAAASFGGSGPPPAPASYDWRSHLDATHQRESRTLRLSGREHVHLQWSGHATLWLSFIDAQGRIAQSVHGDSGDIEFQLSIGSAQYRVTVGQFAEAGTSFRVTTGS